MDKLLTGYTKFNYWANSRLAACLKKMPAELMDKELKSSFNTIKLTVLHIYDAETIWRERLNNNSPKNWPSTVFTGSSSEAIELLLNSSDLLMKKTQDLKPDFISSEISFFDMKGNPHKSGVFDIIQHAVNHSTFHRGQLVTMLRELGVTEIPSTDYITFVRESS